MNDSNPARRAESDTEARARAAGYARQGQGHEGAVGQHATGGTARGAVGYGRPSLEGLLVGIYVRLSEARDGSTAGVDRQEEACRALCEFRKFVVHRIYCDNDVSATGKKKRPEYERMLTDLRNGVIKGAVALHVDRITRKPTEMETLITESETYGFELATVQGEIDLGTPSGRMMARILGAAARYEVERKGERQRLANRQAAQQGQGWYGGLRAYGYTKDNRKLVEAEAAVIRDIAARILRTPDPETIYSICSQLLNDGVRTTTGKAFQRVTLRRMMMNPRLTGKRVVDGELMSEDAYPRIISDDEHQRLVAVLTDPERQSAGAEFSPRRYLLTGGYAVCGLCGAGLSAQPSGNGDKGYACRKTPESDSGCGRIRIVAKHLEGPVIGRVLTRYCSPPLRRRLENAAKLTQAGGEGVGERITQLEGRLAELGRDLGLGDMTKIAFKAAENAITEEITGLKKAITQSTRLDMLPRVVSPESLSEWWCDPSTGIEQKRALIGAVLEHVIVNPATRRGSRAIDEDRLDYVWR